MVMNKRAQFFLLAAVIISAVVISLGVNPNRATVSREPNNFYDFSYEVKREAGAVIDWEIYTFEDGVFQDDLEEFVDLLAKDIKDKNPDANFKFIYGEGETLVQRDFGESGSGAIAISSLCLGSVCSDIEADAGIYDAAAGTTTLTVGDDDDVSNFVVKIGEYEFDFPVSEYRQVVFIMQKDVNDESFVTVR